MSKIDLTTVESGFLSQVALNSNFTKLETELQNKVLYRDNPTGEPNSMQQDLDMNGHRILNLLGEGGDGFIWKQSWNDGLEYKVNNIAYIPSGLWEGYTMICREEHTSSALFQTDYDAGKWEILAARGASGSGTGDLVASNNLSDVASTSAALTNLNGMPKTGGTFTGDIIVPDEAYDASSWNGNNEVPTKNAIRDKFESFSSVSVVNSANDPTFTSTSSTEAASPEWVNGKALIQEGALVTTSGASFYDFTGIPAGVKRVKIIMNSISLNGSSLPLIQLGDSGGIENTGYISVSSNLASGVVTTNSTSGIVAFVLAGAPNSASGVIEIDLIDSTTNTYIAKGVMQNEISSLSTCTVVGKKSLSSTLTQLRLTSVSGSDLFDNGSAKITYEY